MSSYQTDQGSKSVAEMAPGSLATISGTATETALAGLFAALRGGGKAQLSGVSKGDLLLAGFVDVAEQQNGVLEASKPEWSGQAQSLKTVWKLDDDDLMEQDLVDEDELLDDIETVQPGGLDLTGGAPIDACGPAKPPCANCVCGRADSASEGQAAAKKQSLAESGAAARGTDGKLVVDTIKLKAAAGGCGSCSLGDAFRCAGCPSKGLPAYTVGEKIVLDL